MNVRFVNGEDDLMGTVTIEDRPWPGDSIETGDGRAFVVLKQPIRWRHERPLGLHPRFVGRIEVQPEGE